MNDVMVLEYVTQPNTTQQARLAAIVHDSDDAIFAKDLNGILLDWNPAAERLYGYTRAEVLGKSVQILFPPESANQLQSILDRIAHGEKIDHFETVRVRKDGTRVDVSVTISPMRDDSGAIVGASVIARNTTVHKRSEQAKEFLDRAATLLNASLNFAETLQTIAQLAVPTLGDWCAVHILMEDGTVRRLAFSHRDPERVTYINARPQQYALDEKAKHLVSYVLRTGVTEFYNEVPDSVLQEAARDAAHLETLRQLGLHAYVCAPLQTRGRILGAVTIAMSDSGREYSPGEVELALELVRRAALAADNAALYTQEQEARLDAEENSIRISALQNITAALGSALTPEDVAQLTLEQSIVALGAHAGSVWLLSQDQHTLEPILGFGYEPEIVEAWREVTIHTRAPMPEAVVTGETILLHGAEMLRTKYPEILERQGKLIGKAWAAIPLILKGRVIGVLGLTFLEEREFDDRDEAFMNALAQQAAQAMERARLYKAEQQARTLAEQHTARTGALQRVTAALSAALTREEIADVTLKLGLPAVGARGGAIAQLTSDGRELELLGLFGYQPANVSKWQHFPVHLDTPMGDVVRTREVLHLSSEQIATRYPQLAAAQTLWGSQVTLPLVANEQVIGALHCSFEKDKNVSATDIEFLNALAQQYAQALERARLYQAEQSARAAAEANAARIAALQRVTAALATTLTRDEVAQVVLEQGLAAFQAQAGALAQLSDDGQIIHLLDAKGYDPQRVQARREIPITATDSALAQVIRTGEMIALESNAERVARFPNSPVPTEFNSWLLIPLEIKGRILGGVTMAFAPPRSFSAADRAFALSLAQQCAQALERARLYESELIARQAAERAAQRSEWLTDASHVLSSSLDDEETLRELAHLAVPEIADWCSISITKDDGTAEPLVIWHKNPEMLEYVEEIKPYFEVDWNAPRGLPRVLREGVSEFYPDIPDAMLVQAAKNETQLEILRKFGLSSAMTVPLNLHSRTLGAISLANAESRRHFTEEDLALAELLAGRAAVAIENARLYRQVQSVNQELQTLNQELEERVEDRTYQLSQAYQELRAEVAERTHAEEMTLALLRISNKLNSTLNVQESLDILIQEATAVIEGTVGIAGLRTAQGMRMYNYYANGKSIPMDHTWAPGQGMPGWVLEHSAPCVTNDAPNDPIMLHELPFNQNVKSAICTPILDAQNEVAGFFEVRDKRSGEPFTGADVDYLMALSPIASIALENARAYQKISQAESAVKDSYVQLRALAARLQTIREEERTDIARELHDELGQSLTALKMDVAALIARLPARGKPLRERAQGMSEQIDATIKTVRRMSSQLRPGMLDDLGLGPSIEWYAQEFSARTNIPVETQVPVEELLLDHVQATALFRIFQETLTNVARHANATQVRATLQFHDNLLILEISDNGQGFDPEQVRGKRSLGLLGMRERAEMVQGKLEIQGEPGKGTTILVTMPLTSEKL